MNMNVNPNAHYCIQRTLVHGAVRDERALVLEGGRTEFALPGTHVVVLAHVHVQVELARVLACSKKIQIIDILVKRD